MDVAVKVVKDLEGVSICSLTSKMLFAIRLCRRLSVRTKSMRKRIIRKGKTAGGKNREFIYGNRDRQKTAV